MPGAIKLASNETPYPPLPHVVERIAEAAAGANRYPDTNSRRADRGARRSGSASTPERVAVGCGSVSLCTQLVQAVADADDEVIYAWRSFEAYPIIAAVSGASSVQVPLRDYVHDLDAMAERDHRQDPADLRLQPEQPDRHGRRRATRWSRSCGAFPTMSWSLWTRPTASSSPTRRPGRARRCSPSTRTSSCCAPSPRPTGWPDCGSATPSPPTRLVTRRCARPRCPSR